MNKCEHEWTHYGDGTKGLAIMCLKCGEVKGPHWDASDPKMDGPISKCWHFIVPALIILYVVGMFVLYG